MYKLVKGVLIFAGVFLYSGFSFSASTYTLPDGEVLNDPTRPLQWSEARSSGTVQAKEPSFKLNYIVASGAEKRAMINGQKVLEGDVISGATVQKIKSDSVYLLLNGKQKALHMNKVNGIQRN